MRGNTVCVSVLLLVGSVAYGAGSPLAFQPAGPGVYEFDTGLFRGRLKLDGKFQGLYPLVDAVSGEDLTKPPGLFSPYRVFTSQERYGNAARDWPTTTRLLPEGAVEVSWPAADSHPLEMVAVYRWLAPDTLDFHVTVTSGQELPAVELFVSNYFTENFRASAYLQAENPQGRPSFVPVDKRAASPRSYVMFPRDLQVLAVIQDGRWKIPPSPVDWEIERCLAAPLAIRRDEIAGITAVIMGRPDSCFALASPWNPATPDARGYRSLYQSLFGGDLATGQSATAHCRLVINRGISDQEALRRYQDFLRQTAP